MFLLHGTALGFVIFLWALVAIGLGRLLLRTAAPPDAKTA
jgi:hypothetical protein